MAMYVTNHFSKDETEARNYTRNAYFTWIFDPKTGFNLNNFK